LEAARRRYNSATNLCKGQDVTGWEISGNILHTFRSPL
jgi:hypothetical protein